MPYRVDQDNNPRKSFGEYNYRIYKNDVLVARYCHDYRGGEHSIEFILGGGESFPVGRVIDFLEGGGPEPLILSARAMAYLDEKLK